MIAGHDFYGVSRVQMREFLDRLKHPSHRDYDVILEIEECLEDAFADEDRASDAEVKLQELRDLCVEAGLIEKGDDETDVLPLLRMFLPVD